MKLKTEFNMKEGESLNRNPDKPMIHINCNGAHTYLWVGNNGKNGNDFCYATLSGKKTLEEFANNILEAINSPT